MKKNYKFKVKHDYLKNKIKKLKKYTTSQEKEFLISDLESFTDTLKIFTKIKPKNELEAAALLFKIREISVSDLIELTSECKVCNFINPINVEIDEFFNLDIETDLPIGLFDDVYDIINIKEADKMPLKDFNKIQKELLQNTEKIFKLSFKRTCQKCGSIMTITVNPSNIMSKSSASSIFKEYVELSYYSNNTKLDVDSMYPFEREIYLNLLNEKLKQNVDPLQK